jgi:hypothetical protein
MDDPLFRSPHAALVFAYSFVAQPERPLMNRMGQDYSPPGKGLGGLDGAAQAGFIRAEVEQLGKLVEAIIIARFAPHALPCTCRSPCCSGRKSNKEWRVALAVIADRARTNALAGCTSTGIMRLAYVERHFCRKDERINLDKLADRLGMHRNTVQDHARRVHVWLAGTRGKVGIPGMEDAAINAISERLIGQGVCEA